MYVYMPHVDHFRLSPHILHVKLYSHAKLHALTLLQHCAVAGNTFLLVTDPLYIDA